MARIVELLHARRCLSVELWPPRSEESARRLSMSLERLREIRPDFCSITYGAGGSTRDRTHELVVEIERSGEMTSMAHLAVAGHRRDELVAILERYRDAGIENVLCLRGDPPLDATEALAPGELAHALELVELARQVGGFCVAVAAHPEGHPDAAGREADRRNLAHKLAAADFAITQFFFDVGDYLRLVEDLSALGIDKPILPGVMPVTSARSLEKMARLSGCKVPAVLAAQVERVADKPAEIRKIGVDVASELCEKLLAENVPGLHFYTMNRMESTSEICARLGLAHWRTARAERP